MTGVSEDLIGAAQENLGAESQEDTVEMALFLAAVLENGAEILDIHGIVADDEDDRGDLVDVLEQLPDVESVDRTMGVALRITVCGEFVPPTVLGVLASHGWGVMSARQGAGGALVEAWPGAPSEVISE